MIGSMTLDKSMTEAEALTMPSKATVVLATTARLDSVNAAEAEALTMPSKATAVLATTARLDSVNAIEIEATSLLLARI